AKAQPIYKNFRGWEDLGEQGWQEVAKKNSLDAFPQNCQKYLKFIKRFLGVPITILGVGPDREKTLVLKELPK
ncbi:adenylosuccinate synthase, partial [Candidatus Parvarchaeota archaeon]|nr:adenylosuccinate synthase [Candidatus Parvarchaeota archaeon]